MDNKIYLDMLESIKNSWLCNKPIAHRGLWDKTSNNENTIEAFKKAIEYNFPIETDVWRIKDGTLVIYHDDNLQRLCGINKKIIDVENVEELKSYLISNKYEIPTFDELLDTVNGKVELLIEIKTYEFNGKTEQKIFDRLKTYNGKYAIESFNPYSVLWFKKHAPNIFRGQLSCYFENTKPKGIQKILKNSIIKLSYTPIVKQHFVAYDKKHYPNKYLDKMSEKGIPILLWTINSEEEIQPNINYIFENFIPQIKT